MEISHHTESRESSVTSGPYASSRLNDYQPLPVLIHLHSLLLHFFPSKCVSHWMVWAYSNTALYIVNWAKKSTFSFVPNPQSLLHPHLMCGWNLVRMEELGQRLTWISVRWERNSSWVKQDWLHNLQGENVPFVQKLLRSSRQQQSIKPSVGPVQLTGHMPKWPAKGHPSRTNSWDIRI